MQAKFSWQQHLSLAHCGAACGAAQLTAAQPAAANGGHHLCCRLVRRILSQQLVSQPVHSNNVREKITVAPSISETKQTLNIRGQTLLFGAGV
jgi:hypothetical protein